MRRKPAAGPPEINATPSNPLRWGDGSQAYPSEGIRAIEEYFERELGRAVRPPSSVGVPPPSPGPSRLAAAEREGLAGIATGGFSTDDRDRVCYSFGRSYEDLTAWRDHRPVPITDAVAWPDTSQELQHLLVFASGRDIAVVPWGGGTSLVGGVVPLAEAHHAVLTVVLGRLSRPLGIDPYTDSVRFEAGVRGPELEGYLEQRGLTLGHFPTSFEFSTLGGWISTGSSGQASSRYGEILDRVTYAKWATPSGFLEWKAGEPGPRGIDPRLILASEGTLGVLVEAGLRLAPSPEKTVFRAILLPSWESSLGILRALAAEEPRPAVARMSDPSESRFLLTLARGGDPPEEIRGLEGLAIRRKIPDLTHVVLGIVSFEGTRTETGRGTYVLEELAKQAGGALLPGGVWPGFGDAWEKTRYRSPALRDGLVPDGWVFETIGGRVVWDDALDVATRVRRAIAEAGTPLGVLARVHVQASRPTPATVELSWSLTYPDPPGKGLEAWTAFQRAGYEALLDGGRTLSAAPGIGATRRAWAARVYSPIELTSIRQLKEEVDPRGILNPGKLLPPPIPLP